MDLQKLCQRRGEFARDGSAFDSIRDRDKYTCRTEKAARRRAQDGSTTREKMNPSKRATFRCATSVLCFDLKPAGSMLFRIVSSWTYPVLRRNVRARP